MKVRPGPDGMGLRGGCWLAVLLASVGAAATSETSAKPTVEVSLRPALAAMEGDRPTVMDSQYRCLELLGRDVPQNRSGAFCNHTWDGWLCWDDAPAGTYATQNCPNYPGFDSSEKVTKYCDESGNWLHIPTINKTWSHCLAFSKDKLKRIPTLGSLEPDPTVETLISPVVTQKVENRKKIIDDQYKCFEKMNRDMPYNKSGPYCNRTWDGWMCWDDTRAGTYTSQNCPSFFPDFDPTEKVTKYCDEMGNWFRHPDTNRTWSNYTLCIAYTKEKLRMAYILYYMAIVGHALSIASLLISLAIFFYFRSLSCQRITLHKNLFCSYVLNSTFTIINLITVVNNPKVVERNPVNLFFLLNIVRVLVTKLRDTHRAESNMYMKAVRATLILVPLLGIQFVILLWRPENRLAGEIYDFIMHILMHYQGLLVATIFCFFNGEVQAVLKRQWVQYKAQWGQRRREHCSMRSTSYTATSITEVPGFMFHHDCNSEHLNGRHADDSELVALKTGETYA
ncbi:calcitonin gene-related peptide type 1 receptor isoform X3 [Denticeps clupeoides]|uniref:calcitonin gene-related peptide type 1 receptor isoform X3 n=1 Tax=Denticeps clupeoides TaxID=299321 RepID=UPI0010A2D7FE|nr:calcitonin receptor isoform X3 [Denticeps clupeoides]